MTSVPNIKSVAVIGGGPSGIAAIYELSRTLKNGHSLFGEKDVSKWEKNGELAFEEIVLFERNGGLGGVWASAARGQNKTDPEVPNLDVADFSDPNQIYSRAPIDDDLEKKLKTSTYSKPVTVEKTKKGPEDKYQWRSSGAYDGLFTNIPKQFLQYTYQKEEVSPKLNYVEHFQTVESLSGYLESVVKTNDLAKYARLNSNVERVRKLDSGKWEVVVRVSKPNGDGVIDSWYRQEFDGVILGSGATVPSIPSIPKFKEFAKTNEGKVNITIAKSVKDPAYLKDSKKILVVGSSVSAIDLVQYAFPRDLEKQPIVLSRSSPKADLDWITFCSYAEGLINKPEIAEFLPESQGVKFADGTVETGFDTVIFATGYHAFYPYLDPKDPELTKFYQFTFSIADPSLASLSNIYSVFVFERLEAQVNAISSVWSHHATLPPKKDQLEWYDANYKGKLYPTAIQTTFIDPLERLGLEDRPGAFYGKTENNPVFDLYNSTHELLSLFYKITRNEATVDSIYS